MSKLLLDKIIRYSGMILRSVRKLCSFKKPSLIARYMAIKVSTARESDGAIVSCWLTIQ